MSNSSSESYWASFTGFYYTFMVFFAPLGFLERRACIFTFRLALEAGAATLATAFGLATAGLAPKTGFLTGA
jgi:hypothetical protein